MTKRKLTRHQQWQIDKVQEERRARANKQDSAIERAIEHGDLSSEQQALLLLQYL